MILDVLLATHEFVHPGTPLDFIPLWVADVWRVVLFVSSALLIGDLITMNYRRYGRWFWRSRANMFFHMAIVYMMLINVVLQIERFGQEVLLEGLVSFTILTVLIGIGAWFYEREDDDGSRSDDNGARRPGPHF